MTPGRTVFVCHETDSHIFITTFRSGSSSFKSLFKGKATPRHREELTTLLDCAGERVIVVFLREPVSRYYSALKLIKMVLRGDMLDHMVNLLKSHSSPYMSVFAGRQIKYIRWERLSEYLPHVGFPSLSKRELPDYYTPPALTDEEDRKMKLEVATYTALLKSNEEMSPDDFKRLAS